MVLEVLKALQQKAPVAFKAKIHFEDNLLSDRMIDFISDCVATGSYSIEEENMVVNADCTVKIKTICDVCCGSFEKAINFTVNQIIPLKHTEESAYEVVNGLVDFDRIVLDEFLLMFPSRLLCNENCELEENN